MRCERELRQGLPAVIIHFQGENTVDLPNRLFNHIKQMLSNMLIHRLIICLAELMEYESKCMHVPKRYCLVCSTLTNLPQQHTEHLLNDFAMTVILIMNTHVS